MNTFLNCQWVRKEIKRGIKKKNLETNKNGNTTYQNLWDVAKAVLREKVIVTNTVLRNKKDLK